MTRKNHPATWKRLRLQYVTTPEEAHKIGRAILAAEFQSHKNPAAVALGRLGGKARKGISTVATRRASRANGKLGGRPPKKKA